MSHGRPNGRAGRGSTIGDADLDLGADVDLELVADASRSLGLSDDDVAFLHRTPEWAGRGLRDSVFASNVSRKKLGDCEFVNRQHAAICAYEAHAGALTDAYVRGHESSFRRVLEGRREDLEMRAEPADWSIRVIFVAHQAVGVENLRQVQVGDFTADFEMIDYDELMERVQMQIASRPDGRSEFATAVNSHLIGPLNESWVPEAIRDRVRERLSASAVSSVTG